MNIMNKYFTMNPKKIKSQWSTYPWRNTSELEYQNSGESSQVARGDQVLRSEVGGREWE